MNDLEQEITLTLQRYEIGLLVVALNSAIDEAQDKQNPVLIQLLMELCRKIESQFVA